MNEIEEVKIENLIYEIRNRQVMLDSDLARLYKVETKRINEAVKNNPLKFPERYSWKLTQEEFFNLRSKISTSNYDKTYGGRRYNPRVFTEQGVAMLATILKSKVAIEVSIRIMDTFVFMRKYISNNLIEQKYINNLVLEDHDKILLLENSFQKFEEKRKINEIYFEGQIYDAYSKIVDIFEYAQEELIIVDGYADKVVLDMIKNLKIKVTLIIKGNGLLSKLDIEKYNKQYSNLEIKYTNIFHDRYFIIDKNIFYHCGASINKMGSKVFSINILEDEIVKESLMNKIRKI